MITESIKRKFVELLGQLLVHELEWHKLLFAEKMELAESVLDSAVKKIKGQDHDDSTLR